LREAGAKRIFTVFGCDGQVRQQLAQSFRHAWVVLDSCSHVQFNVRYAVCKQLPATTPRVCMLMAEPQQGIWYRQRLGAAATL
jgi:hypothetical protein